MTVSLFDVLTVSCFVGLIIVFVLKTDHSPRVLMLYIGFGVLLAVANQVGDRGYGIVAAALVAVAAVFAISQAVHSPKSR